MVGWRKKDRLSKSREPEKPNFGIPTVKFDASKVTETVKADLVENIRSLPDIATADIDTIYHAALAAIVAGGALNIIHGALMKLDGITMRRAEQILRSLSFKANAIMTAETQRRLGVKHATWLYSGGPCGEDDAAHRAADGKPYLVANGMLLDGRSTWPGREEGCKCASRPLIKGRRLHRRDAGRILNGFDGKFRCLSPSPHRAGEKAMAENRHPPPLTPTVCN